MKYISLREILMDILDVYRNLTSRKRKIRRYPLEKETPITLRPESLPPPASTTISSPIRGRLLLEMLNNTAQIILNGRFDSSGKGAGHIPATFARCEKNANVTPLESSAL